MTSTRAPLLLLLLLAPAFALGQRAASGVLQPTGDVAAGVHAESLEDNPAGIGFGGPFDLTYAFTGTREERSGEGHAVFAALGVLDPYHTALGLQFLDAPGDQGHEPVKFSWGHALRLERAFSVGITWSHFIADDDPGLDGFDTWDLGLASRFTRWIAAGVTVTDFTSPRLRGQIVERGYEAGLALRPLTDRLTLSGRVRVEEDRDTRPIYGGRLAWNLWGPFGIAGRYDTTERAGEREHRLMVGLTDQITGNLGLGLFGYFPDLAAGGSSSGVSVIARASAIDEPARPLLEPHQVVEVPLGSNLDELSSGGFFSSKPTTPFLTTLRRLRVLEGRDDVDVILLSIGDPGLGWGQAEELREAVGSLRAAGKTVYAYLTVADTRGYTVAAAADRIFIAPSGGVLLTGLRGQMYYLGTLLKRVGVNPQFVAIGDFKSAPEMFTRSEPSDSAREVENSLLDDLYGRVLASIAQGRGMTPDDIRERINQAPYTAKGAKDAGLVDEIIHYDEFEHVMRETLGGRVRFAEVGDFLEGRDARWPALPEIGVLYCVGTITDGESISNPLTGSISTGADTFVEAARALREDDNVRAVVLRVDSPGGSVTAADAMWRELSELAKKKPLVVSMGDVAASGGYYIAAAGDEIFADDDTITGSIGIFTGKFDISGLYWLLGVHKELFLRGERAALLSEARAWSDEEITVVRASMQELYDLFLERVAAGRKDLDTAQVNAIAQGRVWTGDQARTRGLVDQPAGLMAAIDRAAERAGLDDDGYVLAIRPLSGGLGGLPRSPVHGLERLLVRLGAPARAAPESVPPALRVLLDLPLLHFTSGQPLALQPFIWVE